MDIREVRRRNLKSLMDREFNGVRGAQSRLAERLGKPQNFISRCLAAPERAGSKTIGEDFAREIEKAFGLDCYALDRPIAASADIKKPENNKDKESNVIAADFSSKGKLKDGEISIPQYNVRGALGHGQIPADYIETIRHVTVHESLLSGRGISFSKADNLAIITGFGQSMEGTINDGDPLIVDRGVNQFIGDGIYVLTWDNLLYVKRLQKHSPTHFDMISDNPRHKDQVINISDVTVHARVLLVWNAKKL
ncbi:S24 family peptidase [Pseudomonas sp. gcc21]|uniref:S24 family peptidase n=1 Tax=Pseudomonas sp. gcc21 TaxID=2726989 RepID=UPI002113F9C4|nr:S24 family peptidase [Pseudomonas sp. gcc21]